MMTMTRITKRLDDLESASGKAEGMAVYYEGAATAKILSPKSRQHQEITLAEFETEYPNGRLIRVSYVKADIPVG
jgi:hypothetical protein